ncbi:MAG TPA: PIN domain-containing protein [Micropepsaceae bacterium]|jgi:predicted nucleic acid-binding protein|nr:PIN domain-containing protein [Micropepsaceae bacterium]
MWSFDTYILVYAADRTAGNRHAASIKLLASSVSGQAALSEQSLVEFLHVATRKLKQPLPDATKLVRAWLDNFALMTAPLTVLEDTVSLLASHSLSVWDAHMIAICRAHGCECLLSEDLADGASYDGVRILNPFNPRNAAALLEVLES